MIYALKGCAARAPEAAMARPTAQQMLAFWRRTLVTLVLLSIYEDENEA